MKRILSLILTAAIILGIAPVFDLTSVFATEQTGTTDYASLWDWKAYGEGVEMTAYKGDQTDVYVPSTVEKDGVKYSVIKLGENLFKDKAYLNSVTLGEGITEIGANAFEGVTNLVCIVTSESLTAIGANAFSGCTAFNSIILYDEVTSIGENAFLNCPNVTIYCNENTIAHTYVLENRIEYTILNPDATPEIYTQDGIEYYIMNGEAIAISFDGSLTEVVIPATINNYPVRELRNTFSNCTLLTKVSLPQSLKTIGTEAFYCCTGLTKIEIPDSVTFIGDSAFYKCSGLVSVDISDSVTRIHNRAFSYCSSLTSIEIPDSVTTIGLSAFSYCTALTTVKIPESVTSIGSDAFCYCANLTSVEIPNSVTRIRISTFYACSSLTKIEIPDSVTHIENGAFANCNSLTSVDISNNTICIGKSAFGNCRNLDTVIIPESVMVIYSNSFAETTIWIVYENSYAYDVAADNDLLYFVYKDENTTPEIYKLDGITYFIMNNEAIAISFDNSAVSVTIPEGVKGYPVTELRSTFIDCTSLINVILPRSLKTIGLKAFYDCDGLTSIEIPENVISIGNYAFSGCNGLTSIEIPEGVTNIGDSAFSSCTALTSAKIPDSVVSIGISAFYWCSSLTSIEIPDSVTGIGNSMFYHCVNLTSVEIPDGVKSIGDNAFYECKSLTSIELPDTITNIGSGAFVYCSNLASAEIPNGVTSIGSDAFAYCSNLASVKIPNSVTSIGSHAFGKCCNLDTVIIPESVMVIYSNSFAETTIWIVYENSYAYNVAQDNDLLYLMIAENTTPEIYKLDGLTYFIANNEAIAFSFDNSAASVTIPESVEGYPVTELRSTFSGCTSLKNVSLPNSLKTIGTKAFYDCDGLTNIEIPENVISIGNSAFSHCDGLTSMEIPDGVTDIGNNAFIGCLGLKNVKMADSVISIGESAFSTCRELTSIELSDNITSIEKSAFSDCRSLSNIEIPDSVTSIGYLSFYGCSSLTNITIPGSVLDIGSTAFSSCGSLISVEISEGVTNIGPWAFAHCDGLTNVKIPDSVTYIDNYAFYDCDNLTFVIIPECVTKFFSDTFSKNTILIVYENSHAHSYVQNLSDCLYFVLRKTENPEIAYGVGISGTATYTDGTVAANATVEMLYDDGVVKETVTTDENGAYNFTYAEVGRYTIRVTDDSGNTGSETVSVKRMNVFDVFLSGETDVVLKKGYTISGTVSPTGDTTVTLTDIDGNIVATAETTDGIFTLENIPNGTYILKAETETGMTAKEITVFNSDILNEILIIDENSAIVTGYVEVEDREFKHHRRNWVDVTIYNSEGVAIASQKTDKDGKYTFRNISIGEYSIVAETAEMRPDKHKRFERSHQLTGYAYVNVTEATTYEVDTIILYEENDNLATISGKVTAQGETQDCKVILRNVFRHEVAKLNTGKNGKYTFKNIKDGLYFITAITESDGMGFAVVVVRDGKVYGETDIFVRKSDRVREHEMYMKENIPECNSKEEALQYRDKIAEEKRFYDSLPEKEKKQFSKEYIERLNKLSELIADCEYEKPDGVEITNGGTVISGDELEEDDVKVKFVLNVTETSPYEITEDGIKTNEQFIQQSIEDTAKGREIVKYYDISLSKNDKEISHIHKHTDTTGKLRITMEIPEGHRGHKNYTFVHMHNGEPTTLVDLDNDPNTVTFEIDRFSTFALTYSNVELTSADDESATIVYDEISGKIKVSSLQDSKLFIATYNGNEVISADVYDIIAGTTEAEYAFNENQAAFIWDGNMNYLCEKFTICE